jgi:hypothetical protein
MEVRTADTAVISLSYYVDLKPDLLREVGSLGTSWPKGIVLALVWLD